MWAYYIAVFLSAFLLFLVQPMLSKALLPSFGGSYLVWGASMVFYQGILLIGYLCSHYFQRRFGVVRYARWHWLMLLVPFAFYPFRFESFSVGSTTLPLTLSVFVILFAAVSLPFLTLSMTSLILQRWLSVTHKTKNPYVLYSISNLGSLLALVLYPLLIEPLTSSKLQGTLWWSGYATLVVMHAFCMPRKDQLAALDDRSERRACEGVSWRDKWRWLLLSLAACAMLLAVTNVITLDVASIPFLWVLPLVVYLLAFVVTFKQRLWFPAWIQRGLYWVVIAGVALHLLSQLRLSPSAAVSIVLHLLILFVVCVNCSGHLVQTKPKDPEHLTTFYVTIAVGGFLGSLLVSWIVPLISSSLIEYLLAFALTFLAVGVSASGPGLGVRLRSGAWKGALLGGGLVVVAVTALPAFLGQWVPAKLLLPVIALPVAILFRYRAGAALHTVWLLVLLVLATPWTEQLSVQAKGVTRLRNYYGIYKVYDQGGLRYLQHGTTQHGRQYLTGPKRNIPLAYFHPSTPAGGVLQSRQIRLNQIGMIGLGTGALATYASEGQEFTIYEIDPDNGFVAESMFTYLEQARRQGAKVELVFGDGRVSLAACAGASLDVLIIDAFSSGAIPVHLLTTEAIASYLRVLRDDGILLLHVSNKMLDLLPVIYSNAQALGVMACEQTNAGHCDPDAELTSWAAMTRDSESFTVLTQSLGWHQRAPERLPAPWTDQFSNVLGAMLW